MGPVFSGDAGYRVEGEGNPTLVHSAGWTFRRLGHRQKKPLVLDVLATSAGAASGRPVNVPHSIDLSTQGSRPSTVWTR